MKFTLEINCDNTAFECDDLFAETKRILLKTAGELDRGYGVLFDINGNKVGSFEFSEDDSES